MSDLLLAYLIIQSSTDFPSIALIDSRFDRTRCYDARTASAEWNGDGVPLAGEVLDEANSTISSTPEPTESKAAGQEVGSGDGTVGHMNTLVFVIAILCGEV